MASEFTLAIDPQADSFTRSVDNLEKRHSEIVKNIVSLHNNVVDLNRSLRSSAKKFNFLTPRDFLDFIQHFVELHKEKKEALEEEE